MTKDQVAYEAVIQEMEWLQTEHKFVGKCWKHNKSGNTYIVVALGIREVDMAVLVVYQKKIPLVAFPEKPELCPIWFRPVGEFLEKFTREPDVPRTYVPGYSLDGSTS